jgi:hypothetical protein
MFLSAPRASTRAADYQGEHDSFTNSIRILRKRFGFRIATCRF